MSNRPTTTIIVTVIQGFNDTESSSTTQSSSTLIMSTTSNIMTSTVTTTPTDLVQNNSDFNHPTPLSISILVVVLLVAILLLVGIICLVRNSNKSNNDSKSTQTIVPPSNPFIQVMNPLKRVKNPTISQPELIDTTYRPIRNAKQSMPSVGSGTVYEPSNLYDHLNAFNESKRRNWEKQRPIYKYYHKRNYAPDSVTSTDQCPSSLYTD